MAESETQARGPERPNKPALPPFRGPGVAAGPVLRPSTDLRGRKTLPPFFAPPVRVGGPLPGAAPRPSVRHGAIAAPEPPAVVAAPEQPVVRFETETPARPITPAGPSWDTPPMPLAATVGTLAESDLDDTLGLAPRPPREAEWTPPVSDPYARPAVEERAVDELAAMAAPATGNITSRDVRESDVSPDPEYATVAHEPVAREAAVLPSLLETPEPVRALADKAEMAEEESERHEPALPPTPFEDSPLSALPATGSLPDVTQRMSGEDITDMFAEPYTALAPSLPPALPIPPEAPPRVAPVPPRRSARKTPPLGTGRAGGRSQAAPRMGRRATPVLSQAITPMSAPMIRRTPMAPSDAVERAPVAPPTALTAMPLSPTPIAVPVQQDIVASRAVAQALETVAARIRAGQIVVAGQVPMGDDVTALAAAVAAALAALLGVQS